jgi:hypothetical protein
MRLGAGTIIDPPRVPTPVSTHVFHLGNFASADECAAAASEAMKSTGSGNPGASYRLLCMRAAKGKIAPPTSVEAVAATAASQLRRGCCAPGCCNAARNGDCTTLPNQAA